MKIKNEKGSVISRIFKDNKYCWLAFGCSAVIMLIVYICYSLIPVSYTHLTLPTIA